MTIGIMEDDLPTAVVLCNYVVDGILNNKYFNNTIECAKVKKRIIHRLDNPNFRYQIVSISSKSTPGPVSYRTRYRKVFCLPAGSKPGDLIIDGDGKVIGMVISANDYNTQGTVLADNLIPGEPNGYVCAVEVCVTKISDPTECSTTRIMIPLKSVYLMIMRITIGQLRGAILEATYDEDIDSVMNGLKMACDALEDAHPQAPDEDSKAIVAGLHSDLFNARASARPFIQRLKTAAKKKNNKPA